MTSMHLVKETGLDPGIAANDVPQAVPHLPSAHLVSIRLVNTYET